MGLEQYQNTNPFVDSVNPQKADKATGAKRLASLAVRGASLGLLGTDQPAEGIVENVAEIGGSVPTMIAASMVASPAAAAGLRGAGLARLAASPTATRLIGAAGAGAVTGGVRAAAHGENPLVGAGLEGALWSATEAVTPARFGGAGVLGKLVGRSRAEQTRPIIEAVTKEVPDLPVWKGMDAVPAVGDDIQAGYPSVVLGPDMAANPRRTAFGPGTGRLTLDNMVELPQIKQEVMPVQTPTAGMAFPPSVEPHFAKYTNPEGLEVLIPKSTEAQNAVLTLSNSDIPRIGGMPLMPAQTSFVKTLPDADKVLKREPLLTSNILLRSEDDVQKLVENGNGIKMGELVVVDKSPDAKSVEDVLGAIGVTEKEADDLAKGPLDEIIYPSPGYGPVKGKIKKSKEQRAKEASGEARPFSVDDVRGAPEELPKAPKPTIVDDPLKPGEKLVFPRDPKKSLKDHKQWVKEQLTIRCKQGVM